MGEMLPLFPLGTVLFPGVVLPLHIFEDRYRQLVRDLMGGPSPRRFGVIAIRKGRETGIDGVSALYETGCTATVRRIAEREDGRFDLVTRGTQRFRLISLSHARPYFEGEVDMLGEDTGGEEAAKLAAAAVRQAFLGYLALLTSQRLAQVSIPELPDEPVALSYLVAASMIIDIPDKQLLLTEPDALHRLGAERRLLARETAMLRSVPSTPAPDLRYSPYSPN